MATKRKVLFRFGSRPDYDALTKKDPNSLYFLLDTHELYRGDVPIGNAHYYEGIAAEDETLDAAINRILGNRDRVINDIAVITDHDGFAHLMMFTDSLRWVELSDRKVKSSAVVFPTGETLDEKILSVLHGLTTDAKVFEFTGDTLSLKDYGKRYYAFISTVPEQGEPGKLGYVPAVPAHYELVEVDINHPWPANLQPRVTDDGTLGWYEPNLTEIEGLQTAVASLETRMVSAEQIIQVHTSDLTTLNRKVTTLQAVVGSVAIGGEPSTGLIARIENLEDKLSKPIGLQKIYVDHIELAMNSDHSVNIPLFGNTRAGVVPAINTAVASLEDMNRKHTLLSADGWVDPVGDLIWNEHEYATVTDYVDARAEDSILRWGILKKKT